MDELEITFLTVFWNDILIRINSVSKVLQKQNMNLSVTAKLIKSLMAHVSEKRDCFEEFESRAKEKSHIDDYQDAYKRVRLCKRTIIFLDGGRNTDVVLQGSRKFKVETSIPIIDSLVNNLEKGIKGYE
jgi:hypothetical protein